ncbi:Chloroperoxidase [Dendryphion nanum]|uniref:Chloroperoxidase n=1 Tax=Dendryphion nanum TaxID=256645 RepID=A0A9P9E669_9PLEO|nr:Chloroperoxidase [Dendryphion nanum]
MPSERDPLLSSIPRGTYAPSGPGDKRSPCPLINSLANHGYISRDGQNIPASDLNSAMNEIGLSTALGAVFAQPIYNLHQDPKTKQWWKNKGFLQRLWYIIRNPWAILSVFGMRKWEQKNTKGKAVLNLDQLALPGVVEHDISLTRRDYLQKEGNNAPQPDLIEDLLACSSDGKTITIEDLSALRKRRIQKQLDDNPGLHYGSMQHQIACTEIALVLDVFGDGKSIPCDYARAFFQEERLPVKEGWKKRWWWTLGFRELAGTVSKIKALVGLQI